MILIAGDSWGCGEWGPKTSLNLSTHRGLEKFIRDEQKRVVNLSVGGGTPVDIIKKLNEYQAKNYDIKISKIFVFQTEWIRDFDPKIVRYTPTLAEEMIVQWYKDLSVLSIKYNCPIYLIGGCSDVLRLNNFDSKFPGLVIACESMTNLLVNDNDKIDNPVFCVRPEEWRVVIAKKSIFDEWATAHTSENYVIKSFIDMLDNGQKRHKVWDDNPQWFWPDGVHPNRSGHEKLFRHLTARGYLD